MKFKLSHFSLVPQVVAISVAVWSEAQAKGPNTTLLGFWLMSLCVILNVLMAAYCSYCMEKGLSIQKISYYERTAFLWERVAEELRKEGKFASPEAMLDTLVEDTKKWDGDK